MINKTKLALGTVAALTIVGVLASSQAMAADPAPKKAKKKHHHKATTVESYHSERSVTTSSGKVDALEAQLQSMQAEIARLRADTRRPAPEAGKVEELDQWMASVKADKAVHKDNERSKTKDNMIYFRGGFARNDSQMPNTVNSVSTINTTAGSTMSSQNGWNMGAGVDFSLNDDLFGLMKNTELLGELDLDYAEFGNFQGNLAKTVGTNVPSSTGTQSQYRITAAPKVKFFKGSKLRPWIIPLGFTMNVMSPPSQANAITELKPAMHFGGGIDYNIWKSVYVGTDVRYNMAFDTLSGTNTNGLTAGGSVGFGF
jgi:opacity protein-like surface antigen